MGTIDTAPGCDTLQTVVGVTLGELFGRRDVEVQGVDDANVVDLREGEPLGTQVDFIVGVTENISHGTDDDDDGIEEGISEIGEHDRVVLGTGVVPSNGAADGSRTGTVDTGITETIELGPIQDSAVGANDDGLARVVDAADGIEEGKELGIEPAPSLCAFDGMPDGVALGTKLGIRVDKLDG